MIHRIQSVYLLLITACLAVCLFMPVGRCVTAGVTSAELYNLRLIMADGASDYTYWALFALLLSTAIISFVTIFLYKKRMLQVRMTIFSIILLLGYCITYGWFAYDLINAFPNAEFKVSWAVSLPVISIILEYLAFRGIMKDEMLIRTLDRLR